MTQAAGVKYSGIIPCGGDDHRGKWSFWGKSRTNGQNPQKDLQNQGTTGKMGGKNQEVWRKFEHLIVFFCVFRNTFYTMVI